jgi:hypothetical protein
MVEIKNAWHQLSPEEREHHLEKVRQALAEVGGKSLLSSDSAWSNEEWQFFGLEEYPNVEAVQKFTERLQEMNHFRYFTTRTILGTPWES